MNEDLGGDSFVGVRGGGDGGQGFASDCWGRGGKGDGVTGLERDGGKGGIGTVVEDDSKWPRRGGERCDGRG